MVKQRVPDAEVDVIWLDLSSKDRIQHFTKEVRAKYRAIHVLINNAGCMVNKREETADGLEKNFATNTLGTYLLTEGLISLLQNENNPSKFSQKDPPNMTNLISLKSKFYQTMKMFLNFILKMVVLGSLPFPLEAC